MKWIDGIPVWGDPVDPGALTQIKLSAQTASKAALMADHHKGYAVPIGGVLAYENAVSPSGVGYDIGCGNKAVRIDYPAGDIQFELKAILDQIQKDIAFGIGQTNPNAPKDHPLFDSPTWSLIPELKELARNQLGTIGGGNHYVDIFVDELNRLWIGVHFGSRGLGHKTATKYLKAGGAKDGMDVAPLVLKLGTPLGDDYMMAMELAGQYAYAGRDWVCDEIAKIIGAPILEAIHNHHNYAWKETHQGIPLIVVRKGATPAFPGQKGFIGASMGETAIIVEGVSHPDNFPSLFSTIHGAGRVMSRTAAKGKKGQPGLISQQDMNEWLAKSKVELRGAGLDEAPQAYKRLSQVIKHHEDSVNILHYLKPIAVIMAGPKEFDPFKD